MDFDGMNNGWKFDLFLKRIVPQLPDDIWAAEVGSFKGYGAISLVTYAKELNKKIRVMAIDRYDGWKGATLSTIVLNIGETNNADCILPIKGDSAERASMFVDGTFHYVFIDASHKYEDTRKDILAWKSKVKSGGILAGHDYHPTQMGVVKAVDELFPEAGKFENCWYTRIK